MMSALRSSLKQIVVWIFLGVLALGFGLSFGLPSDAITCGVEPLAKAYGAKITDEDYQYQLAAITIAGLTPKDEQFQEMMGLKEEVLDAIVERRVLAQIGERLGLATVKEDAEDMTSDGHVIVLGNTYDWLGDSPFNYETFKRNFLPRFMVTEPKYLEYQRQELLARTVRDLIAAAVTIPESELRAEYERRQNKLSLRYVRFEQLRYADLVDAEEADVAKHLEAHKDELVKAYEAQGSRFNKLPKQVRLRFIAVKKPSKPADDADKPTKAAYDAALKAARAKVDAAAKKLGAGEDFRKVARETSEDADSASRGGDRGWVSVESGSGLDPVVDQTAQGLTPGATSKVVDSDEAFYLVRVDGAREGDVPQEEALRELAEEAVMRERGKALAKQAAAEALQALKDGKKLTDLFKSPDAMGLDKPGIDALDPADEAAAPATTSTGPEIRVTGLFAKERPIPGLGQNPDLTNAAWAADPKAEYIDQLFETPDGFVIAAVERKETATPEGLAAARVELYRELAELKAGKVTARFAFHQCLADKARGEIAPNEAKVRRLMVYDTKLAVDEQGNRQLKPYVMCDRVGNRGGMLRAAAMAGGAR